MEGKSTATPLSLVAPITHLLDLSNEVHNVSELPLVPKIPAVKVERWKKTSVLVLKWTFFFDRSSLTAGHFGTSGSSETLCTSFERSNQCLIGA